MDGQRQRVGGRRNRKKKKRAEPKARAEPVTIVARRPDSPRMLKVSRRGIAASAQPKRAQQDNPDEVADAGIKLEPERRRRAARILETKASPLTEDELRQERLVERLRLSEGRAAITAAANALTESGIQFPEQQDVQLQLLEHTDENHASQAIAVMRRLLEEQEPIKRPILDQRLRRLEDEAEDTEVRQQAAELRRYIRVA